MALPLLPLHEVETSFYQLHSTASSRIKQELRQLFLYYDDYWMNTVPLKMWNVHGYEHRTNNICEGMYAARVSCDVGIRVILVGFHNRLNRRLERAHANIWSFIRCVIGEESRFQHSYVQINTGAQRRPKSTFADLIQKRINALNERFAKKEIEAEELLNGLSMLIGKNK